MIFENYRCDLYTSENIGLLPEALDRDVHDAVLIGSNALNDQDIRQTVLDNEKTIARYLSGEKGMVVLHQMRMTTLDSYSFLPEKFRVACIDRKKENPLERAIEGRISFSEPHAQHAVLIYPNRIRSHLLIERCMSTKGIEGLYWHYLRALDERSWDVLIVDNSYKQQRPLLMVSRADLNPRIVLSSLTVDWHRQTDLFENVLRYAAEGRPSTAVIQRSTPSSFPLRYLLADLRLSKFPHSVYTRDKLSLRDVRLDVHNTLIFDPSWGEKDLSPEDTETLDRAIKRGAKTMFFERTKLDQTGMLVSGGVPQFERISKNSIAWIHSRFQNRLWDGSFWSTVDVLESLLLLNKPIDCYERDILSYVDEHNIDGSYDEVFGATCALLWLYWMFRGPKSPAFKKTLTWIQKRIDGCKLYEKALAYDVLSKVGVRISETALARFKTEVLEELESHVDEVRLYRYAKTLLSYGLRPEAERVVQKLAFMQIPEGRWIDVPTTAVIVSLLVRLRSLGTVASTDIDQMIFKGVVYIREKYSDHSHNWGNKASITARALVALKDFESMISGFPVDDVVDLIRSGDRRGRDIVAMDVASGIIQSLQKETSDKTRRIEILAKREAFVGHLAGYAALVATFSSIVLMLLLAYLATVSMLPDALRVIFVDWMGLRGVLLTIAAVGTLAVLYLLASYGLLPKKLKSVFAALLSLLGLRLPEQESREP